MRYESLKNFHSCLLEMWQDVQKGVVSIDDIKPYYYANKHGVGVFRKSFVMDALKSQEEPTRETSDAIRLQIAEHNKLIDINRTLLSKFRYHFARNLRCYYIFIEEGNLNEIKELLDSCLKHSCKDMLIGDFNEHKFNRGSIVRARKACTRFLREATLKDIHALWEEWGYSWCFNFATENLERAFVEVTRDAEPEVILRGGWELIYIHLQIG